MYETKTKGNRKHLYKFMQVFFLYIVLTQYIAENVW